MTFTAKAEFNSIEEYFDHIIDEIGKISSEFSDLSISRYITERDRRKAHYYSIALHQAVDTALLYTPHKQ